MKRFINFTWLLCVALGFLALPSCSTEDELDAITLSASDSTEANSKMRPLKGTFELYHQVLPGSVFPVQNIRIEGFGQLSHLGKTSFVNLSTLVLTPPAPFISTGTSVMTAANGDQLFTSFRSVHTPQPDGSTYVVITHTVTGGTGRFLDASGGYTGITYAIPGVVPGILEVTGEIAY
ncbi:hypothetical protein [Pontibacter roseus]|uniref:hypothetical protein n=1 Tax=Pontibacter roseus TaxID=336989 RepID=UPI00037384CE|nr:hypothetical protein [Pontibacter roseus]